MKFIYGIARVAVMVALVLAAAAPAMAESTADKLNAAIEGMSAEQQAALLLLISSMSGCTEECCAGDKAEAAASSASPEDAVKAAIQTFADAAAAGDMDKMLSVFSDDFEHYQYGDKDGIQEFLQQSADMGYLEGIEFYMDDAEFEEDGDVISVYPVDVEGSFGAVTFEYILANEDGKWLIVEFDASGL